MSFIVIGGPCNVNPWAGILDGDVFGDQAVTAVDLARVADNWGQTGNLTRFDGDLNGDGIVDEFDMDIVIANLETLGMLVEYGLDAPAPPEIGADEVAVLNMDELAWYAVPESDPSAIPIGPGHGFTPIRYVNLVCADLECDSGEDCDDPPGCVEFDPCDPDCGWDDVLDMPYGPCHDDCEEEKEFDPCDSDCGWDRDGERYGQCHPECPERFCYPNCCKAPDCDQEVEQYDNCHEQCPRRFCYAACCEPPDCDPEVENYSECHRECPDFDACNSDCGWDDDEGAPFGPCHPECGQLVFDPCNPACGKDKWGKDYGECHPECPGAVCLSHCPQYTKCAPQCNPDPVECEGEDWDWGWWGPPDQGEPGEPDGGEEPNCEVERHQIFRCVDDDDGPCAENPCHADCNSAVQGGVRWGGR